MKKRLSLFLLLSLCVATLHSCMRSSEVDDQNYYLDQIRIKGFVTEDVAYQLFYTAASEIERVVFFYPDGTLSEKKIESVTMPEKEIKATKWVWDNGDTETYFSDVSDQLIRIEYSSGDYTEFEYSASHIWKANVYDLVGLKETYLYTWIDGNLAKEEYTHREGGNYIRNYTYDYRPNRLSVSFAHIPGAEWFFKYRFHGTKNLMTGYTEGEKKVLYQHALNKYNFPGRIIEKDLLTGAMKVSSIIYWNEKPGWMIPSDPQM